jgi:hypothetical protein
MLSGLEKDCFLETLNRGRYSLLLGAGVSLDSLNIKNQCMQSGEKLRKELARIIGANDSTPLNKLTSYLDEKQVADYLTRAFTVKKPGNSLKRIPNYIWKNVYTFNIDNVLEKIYSECVNPKQQINTINFPDKYIIPRNKSDLQIIHLHGFVDRSIENYIFSLNDYVTLIDTINPWMVTLAESFSCEPFVIAGASLNEIDLEYYFAKRKSKKVSSTSEPTILIEPCPDKILEKECKNNNIILVHATIEDFMEWVYSLMPSPKTIEDLLENALPVFGEEHISKYDKLQFYTDFQALQFHEMAQSTTISKFFWGTEPAIDDINQKLDVERSNTFETFNEILRHINSSDNYLYIIYDESFSGKTTYVFRILEKLSAHNINIIRINNQNRIDTSNALRCLSYVSSKTIIWVDNIADRISEVTDPAIFIQTLLLMKKYPSLLIPYIIRN